MTRLDLTRPQILAFRRQAGALDQRLTAEAESLPLPGRDGRRITVRWDDGG